MSPAIRQRWQDWNAKFSARSLRERALMAELLKALFVVLTVSFCGFIFARIAFQEIADGKTIQLRMVFQNVTPSTLHWEWQRTDDNWATNLAMMTIEYRRR